eukprot:scaffold7987_cov200-Cylindrotheca_fusiformis.AAC.19
MKSKKSHIRRADRVSSEAWKHTKLLSAVTWDVFSPPPSNSMKGKLLPGGLGRYRHRRKLSIEVHDQQTPDNGHYKECVLRVLVPSNKVKNAEAVREGLLKMRKEEGSEETFTSVRHIDTGGTDDDDHTVHTMGAGVLRDTGGRDFEGWKPRYRIPITGMTEKRQEGRSVFVTIEAGLTQQEREYIFDSGDDAIGFCETLQHEKNLEQNRKEERIKSALGGLSLPAFETISLLIEIVSCWDIPAGDITGTSDPFVVCMMGREQIHKTDVIPRTLEPIYTIKTGSLFILTVESKELFMNGGLSFLVEDRDGFSSNDLLGVTTVPAVALYKAKGERMEFKFNTKGFLAIRCRRATEHDKEFMAQYNKSRVAVVTQDRPKTLGNDILSMIAKSTKKVDGTKVYKVRPGPDPENVEKTEWMSDEAIKEAMMEPSRHWLDSGTGDLGMVHLEILECLDLPNMDVGGFLGNKTDAFVAVVYEDTYVATDTINDCLSPRWLPWTKRAFTLRMAHPSSRILIGVFDYDPGLSDHDLIGRVSIDVTNMEVDTEYLLSYDLFASSHIEGRKSRGIVRVRLRMEVPNARRYAMAGIEPPKVCFINVKGKKDFRVVRQTCMGMYDYTRYLNELRAYQHVSFYLEDALATLLLWRGHFPVRVGSKELMLPLHSLSAFLGWRNHSPNLWRRCSSYKSILQEIFTGKKPNRQKTIKPFQNWEETKAELDGYMARIVEAQKQAAIAEAKAAKDALIHEKEEEKRLEDLKETDTTTKTRGIVASVDPMARTMLPFQLALGMFCRIVRFAKNVIIWEEAYFSFWLVTTCIFLSIACLFIPWLWLLKWGSRLFVWTVFGPWMKLLDLFLDRIKEKWSNTELWEQLEAARSLDAKLERRVKKENAKKMKQMKQYMFGKFSMEVPVLKMERYSDVPLPDSSAKPYQSKELSLAEIAMEEAGYNRTRIPGQNLIGDMIPKIESQNFTVAPTGQAILRFDMLSPRSLGLGMKEAGSTRDAYVKIGSIVVAAGVLTVVGVPFLASCTELLVSKALGHG